MKTIHKFLLLFSVSLLSVVIIANNAFNQTEWIKYGENPVFKGGPPGSWNEDSGMPFVLFDGVTYHMWYTGVDSNSYTCFGYASSSDGISWDDFEGNPVLTPGEGDSWDASVIETHCVIYDNSMFHMWYTGYNNNITTVHACVGYATSPDGKTWQKYEGNPVMTPIADSWEGTAVGGAQVIKIDDTFHMWYVGSFKYDIGYATSLDGITWNRYEGNPIMQHESFLWTCQVIFNENNYQMYYQQGPATNITFNLAISPDGRNWTPALANPVLERGEQGDWDEAFLGTCTVVSIDDTNKMWYTARDNNGDGAIGYTTSYLHNHDVKVISLFDSLKAVPFYCEVEFTPKANVMNVGMSDEYNVIVKCTINSSGDEIYHDIITIDTLKKSLIECKEVIFTPWQKGMKDECVYEVLYFTSLATDQNVLNDTLSTTIHASNLIDDFESNLYKWTPDTCWDITISSASSGSASLRNTTKSFYDINVNSWIEFNFPFDLSKFTEAHLSFWTKYYIETEKDFGYIEVSTDGGQNWIQLGNAFTGVQASWKKDTRSLNNFCGTGFDDVKVRFHFISDSVAGHPSLGWFIDDVKIYPAPESVSYENFDHVPNKYLLVNNYPNPFNSQTVISYQLAENTHVKLVIYNLLGRKITILVNQKQDAGLHRSQWNGKDDLGNIAPSGVYFYKMETDHFCQIQKMLFLK